jgi:hypothetical protein
MIAACIRTCVRTTSLMCVASCQHMNNMNQCQYFKNKNTLLKQFAGKEKTKQVFTKITRGRAELSVSKKDIRTNNMTCQH